MERLEKVVFKKLDEAMKESAKREAARRAAWMAEEQERRLRMRAEAERIKGTRDPVRQEAENKKFETQEELLHIVNHAKSLNLEEQARFEQEMTVCQDILSESVIREITKTEVLIAEAKERTRRMQEDGGYDPLLSDVHEKIQEEFMSKVSMKQTKALEEQERERRVKQDKKVEAVQDFETRVERNINYLKTIVAEEAERNRRVLEEMGFGTIDNPISEEIVREVTRRETWLLEERERARRMLEGEGLEIANEVERFLNHQTVISLEERERERRIALEKALKKEAHEKKVHGDTTPLNPGEITEFPSEVQEEFMSAVSRITSRKAEEKEKARRIAVEEITEEIQSEANLFLTWALEERERRRRIFEDIAQDFEDLLQREALKEEVIALEEQERERRIRMEKTHKHPDSKEQNLDDLKEEVKHEFIALVDRKVTAEAEEAERKRRIAEEKILQWRDEEKEKIASKLSRVATRRLEEIERDRRIHAELDAKFKANLDSELDRRKCVTLEEEERLRRVMEGKLKLAPEKEQARKSLLADVVHHHVDTK